MQSLAAAAPIADVLVDSVAPRVASIAAFVAAGVFLANLAVAFGLVDRIAALSQYLTDPANLPREVGTAILATTASPTAGYGMLAEFRESGVLDDRATLVAVTINTFFGFAQHIFTFYAPVLIPILGLRVGLLYVGARAAISLSITLVGLLAGALLLSDRNVDRGRAAEVDAHAPDGGETTAREKVREAAASTAEKLRSILPRLAVVYTAVALVVARYDVQQLTAVADPLTAPLGLPGAAPSVVAVFAVDTTSGALFVAPLIADGVFTPRQAVATMLLGGIVSFAFSTFKRSIPFQYGIWGAEFGSKVIAVNTALKVVFIALTVAALLVP
ncbi:nucleoside recognition protein [Halomicrobium salinisoli]|uniref:nucleoside recognition protein n=1 Tax=Halomicrobium salinisoli TaxID=2878391 RepID=UPI001CF043FC|nr:nucleoside recognition protein [Halomicrobium salinisoli]